ncbi:hypothetical protein ABMA28_008940 [Loxostege sticticalis]|uniref:Integrase catalytic domain-containing protein n=1 Tax=Loxostege sticticalis TaxID=481309 RepID=A0ABD0SF58_LOXSC
MEDLVHLQVDSYDRMKKALINYKKSPKERITQQYVQIRLDSLNELWSKFNNTHDKIVRGSTGRELAYFKDDMYELVEELYTEYKTVLKQVLETFEKPEKVVSNVLNPNSSQTQSPNIQLPRIVIPTFTGQYSEWTTFRDLFVSLVHSNSQLDNVQKMHYLKGYLSGEPEQLLRQIPIADSNYTRCWTLLNSRYNNKKFLCHSILKKLLSQRNIVGESANMLKGLIDTTTDCLSALTNIGVDVTSWDILIIHLLTLKLDEDSRKEWELYISNNSELDELPKFTQFKDFLTKRYRALEFLEPKSSVSYKAQNVQFQNVNKPRVFHAVELKCEFCSENHKIGNCKKFAKEDVDNRRSFIEKNRLCFNCFGHHAAKVCQSTISCRVCKRKHHSMLHPKISNDEGSGRSGDVSSGSTSAQGSSKVFVSLSGEEVEGSSTKKIVASSSAEESDPVVTCYSSNQLPVQSQVLLATALVKAESCNGERHLIRALLDQGSQASFVTEAVAQYLGLKKMPVHGRISGLEGNDNIAVKYMVQLKVHPRFDSTTVITVQAYILKSITSFLPSKKVVELEWINKSDICLADPQYNIPNKIDVLFGAEVFGQVIQGEIKRGSEGSLVAQSTSLGWIISGTTQQIQSNHIVVMHALTDDYLKVFWEMEADPKSQPKMLSQEEEECEIFYAQTTCRDSQGRYIVRLPFKQQNVEFENSKLIAERRLRYLESRFNKNESLKKSYAKVVKEYEDLNHMEIVPKKEQNGNKSFFLPHHAVIREDRDTTKIRVVFDASCKDQNGNSLNDALMIGPTLQPELRHLLIRWRKYPICLGADIVKMYRQVKVADQDTDYQRLLWCDQWYGEDEDNDNVEGIRKTKANIQEYRLLRVTFGTASAPYLAVKTLQQLAHDEGELYPETAKKIISDFYVDDFLSGCQTVEEGLQIYRELNIMMEKGGFELQKWMTNDGELLERLKKEEEGKNIGEGMNLKTDEIVKLLGLTWNRRTDEFQYTVTLPPQTGPVTKRKVLSDIARLYDPLGWLAPCIIKAKILIQKLWLAGINWDEELPSVILKEWITYRNELVNITHFKLPRWMKTKADDLVVELHGFADASNAAYSAVVYLRVIDSDENIHVSLVTCKTKVAPIKQISIPRMELCGATLLSKLLKEVAGVLNIERSQIHAWSDSEVVLAWLRGHPSKWQTFVGNRVSEILSTLDSNQWSHIPSSQNPADCASRGLNPSDLLKNTLWFHGPPLLQEKTVKYSKPKNDETQLEMRKVHFAEVDEFIWNKYSSWTKLVRVVAYCRRFLGCKDKSERLHNYLTAQELKQATDTCIRQCQREHFKKEFELLEANHPNQIKGPLKPLNPFIDESGLLRVGGRLERSQLNKNMKHPVLLPKKSHVTDLIVADAHTKTLHGGPQLMLTYLQSKYWILGSKLLTKSCVRKCVTCFKDRAKSAAPLMGQLPATRVTPSRPFKCCGIDYAGPINVRTTKGRGYKSYKGYICIFICMATRAIHLEVVSDLTTEGFLSAFKRFVARRGLCTDVWSDNGTNFVGAAKELRTLFASENSEMLREVADSLASQGTSWHFIPPRSPNFGGLWEAGVKSVKTHLRKVIGDTTLTYEELSTVLIQIEACLNSRPLTQLRTDPESLEVLTPGHLLVGEPLVTLPDNNFETSNISSLRRWQLTQKLMQQFWRRWSQEYLNQFLHRYRWSHQTPEPQLGDIVLIKENDLPPCKWLLGRVIAKHPGTDNITRVVTLRTKTTLIKRPVSKLCILPIDTGLTADQ